MSLSSISAITLEGQPQELSSFLRSGVMYLLWHSPINDTGLKRLRWKPHTGIDFTEVVPSLAFDFRNISAIYHPSSDQLVVVWDDGRSVVDSVNGSIYIARFNVLTGALISGPTVIYSGSSPKLSYRTTAGDLMVLYHLTPKSGGVYSHISSNGGVTWQSGEPIITNQVLKTTQIEVVPYDSGHVSIAQLGGDPRGLAEIGMLQRTRPICSIVKHPTVAGQFFIGEPSKFDNTTIIDNLRGGLVLSTDNSKLFHLDGLQQGTSDSVNSVALLTVTGTSVAVTASAGPASGANGDDLVSYSLVPALGALNVDLSGASYAVALDVSATHGYIAEYSDSSGVLGQLSVIDLSSGSTATVFTGVTAVRAVGVANFLGTPLIFVATTEGGLEKLRVYSQNALIPTLLLTTKLPARANSITIAVHPTNVSGARVLVSMVDRFNIYEYNSSSTPVMLVDSFQFSGGGQFFKSVVAASGSIVVAAGNAGALVMSSSGRIKAQLKVSGKVVSDWTANTSFTSGQFVKARDRHQSSRLRLYFRCTTTGVSGNSEPSWASSGTILDSGAQWTAQGTIDGVATDVALDETSKRIYIVGVAGGDLGTDGRLWILNAGGLF